MTHAMRAGPLLALLLVGPAAAAAVTPAPIVTPKKGIGHWGDRHPDAPDRLGCSWYYNWGPRPADTAKDTKAEFIPMFWSGKDVTDDNIAFVKSRKYPALLGFNEPDNQGQAEMTVGEALALWPRLEATGLRLGSPGTCMWAKWHDEFMAGAKAKGYRVDFLALHWYGDITKPDAVGDLKAFLEHYWNTYHLPIWLTEYSGGTWKGNVRKVTWEDNARFAKETVEMMERLPFVERYAWFTSYWSTKDRSYPDPGQADRNGYTPVGLAWIAAPAR